MKKVYKLILIILIVLVCVLYFQTKVNAADEEGNLVIVLDPGHGGSDPGALNNSLGLQEASINYKIATYAKQELENYEGVKVYLTRYANNPTIAERGEFAKDYNADLVVSIHINSGVSSARGAEIWVTQDKTQVEFYERSKIVGEKILNQISKLGIKNNGVSTRSGKADEWYESGVVKDYYGIIRYPMNYGIRSILVEHCYISNNNDCQYINSDEKLKKLGIADAQGIVEAYQLHKKGEGKEPVRTMKLDKNEITLEISNEIPEPLSTLNAIYTPTNAYMQGADWYSSNPEVVRVWDGRIRGLKEGEATITAISWNNQRIAKCKVKVTKPQIQLKGISVDKTEQTVGIDETGDIIISFNPSNASNQTLNWESSNPDVVRIWNGHFRGLKEGTSVITATSIAGGYIASCTVTVKDSSEIYVEEINLVTTSYEVVENEAVDIPFSYYPEDATNTEFDWISSNPEILRVYNNRFRGLKEGTAEVIVRTRDGSLERRIKVVVKKAYVQEINLQTLKYEINVDEAVDIPFSYYPENAINAEFEWISSNPDILRVYNNRFRGLKEGMAEVIVRTRDGSLEKRITVVIKEDKKYVEQINVEQTEYIVKENEAVDIPFTYSPIDAVNAEFEWYSTNPEILRVYNNRFRGLKKGMAEVVAKTLDGTVELRIKVTIE